MKTFNVEILWEDLIDGTKGEYSRCAIAKAINRAYPHLTNVTVGLQTIKFNDKTKRTKYQFITPKPARTFIQKFDDGKAEPGLEFALDPDHAWLTPMPKPSPGASRVIPGTKKAVVKRGPRTQTRRVS